MTKKVYTMGQSVWNKKSDFAGFLILAPKLYVSHDILSMHMHQWKNSDMQYILIYV